MYEVARSAFDEKERGSLEQGKIMDMVILNKNPLELAPPRLKELKIEQLYLSGGNTNREWGLLVCC